MPTDSALDTVIRRIEPTAAVEPSCQVLVTIDARTGQPPRTGWWPALSREHQRHFLVTNSRSPAAVVRRENLRIAINDFASALRFELLLDYEARCAPGREVRVALALWQGPSPQARLEEILQRRVLDRLAGRAPDWLRDVETGCRALEEELRIRAYEETGLTVAVRARLADADKLLPLPFGPLSIRTGVCDCDAEVEAEIEGELSIAPGEQQIAFSRRDQNAELVHSLVGETSRYFERQVTLHHYQFDLSETVQQGLWQKLDVFLAGSGWKISRLKVKGAPLPAVIVSPPPFEHTFSHRPHDYPGTVNIRASALLQLHDLGAYRRARSPDLESWMRGEIERAVVESLFGERYTDLCLHYEEKKAGIEQRMKARASLIGYELKQLITITNLAIEDLRRPFTMQIRDEFETKLAELKVGLDVEASVSLTKVAKIRDLLDRQVEVKTHVAKAVEERLREYLHHVDPESFYMRFEAGEDGSSVRAQLEAAIRDVLESRFHAQIFALSCKQLPTELSRLLTDLMEPLHDFEVQVTGRGGPPVCFDGSFRVEGVDPEGWARFKTTKPEQDQLRLIVSQHLKHSLSDVPASRLLGMLNLEWREDVSRRVQDRIRDEFGLVVRLMDWSRRQLDIEATAAALWIRQKENALQARSRRLILQDALDTHDLQMLAEMADHQRKLLGSLTDRLERLTKSGDLPQEETSLRREIAELEVEYRKTIEATQRELAGGIPTRSPLAEGIVFDVPEDPASTGGNLPAQTEEPGTPES